MIVTRGLIKQKGSNHSNTQASDKGASRASILECLTLVCRSRFHQS